MNFSRRPDPWTIPSGPYAGQMIERLSENVLWQLIHENTHAARCKRELHRRRRVEEQAERREREAERDRQQRQKQRLEREQRRRETEIRRQVKERAGGSDDPDNDPEPQARQEGEQ